MPSKVIELSSTGIDPAVVRAIQERGFLLLPDRPELTFIDEHGHMLTGRQLVNETPESVTDLIRHLHHEDL